MTSPASSRGLTAASAAAKAVVIFTAVLNINQVQLLIALVRAEVDVKIIFSPLRPIRTETIIGMEAGDTGSEARSTEGGT